MSKNLYKVDIPILKLSIKSLKFKIEAEQVVNRTINEFYYGKEGDIKKFYTKLNIIRKNFDFTSEDESYGVKEILNKVVQDINSFQEFVISLENISQEFNIEKLSSNESESLKNISLNSIIKKSNLNNREQNG